jgi:hypothetical protein
MTVYHILYADGGVGSDWASLEGVRNLARMKRVRANRPVAIIRVTPK